MLMRMWKKGTFIHCWWECKLEQPLWKTVGRFPKNLTKNYHRTHQPSLWVYIQSRRNRCLEEISVLLCTLQHCWHQLRHGNNLSISLEMNGWRKGGIHVYTYTHISISIYTCVYIFTHPQWDVKSTEAPPSATAWRKLEGIVLHEISWTEKDKCCLVTLTCGMLKRTKERRNKCSSNSNIMYKRE